MANAVDHYSGRHSLFFKKKPIIFIVIALIGALTAGTPAIEALDAPVFQQETVEEQVRSYFQDTPILAEIARCESGFRHYTESGSILRGVVNSNDVGVMQINTRFHLETAKRLSLNIHDFSGNLAYAQYLYEKEGTLPWSTSKPCWGKNLSP